MIEQSGHHRLFRWFSLASPDLLRHSATGIIPCSIGYRQTDADSVQVRLGNPAARFSSTPGAHHTFWVDQS